MNIDKAQKYRDAAARGWTQAETARQLGVSREAVRAVANRHGIMFALKPREIADMRKLRAEALSGVMTREELAQELGIGVARVSTIAKGKTVRKLPAKTRPRAEQIAALAAQGMTISEVARSLGIPRASVSWAKAEYGIVFLRDGRSKPKTEGAA